MNIFQITLWASPPLNTLVLTLLETFPSRTVHSDVFFNCFHAPLTIISCLLHGLSFALAILYLFLFKYYLFIYLFRLRRVLVEACRLLSCGM